MDWNMVHTRTHKHTHTVGPPSLNGIYSIESFLICLMTLICCGYLAVNILHSNRSWGTGMNKGRRSLVCVSLQSQYPPRTTDTYRNSQNKIACCTERYLDNWMRHSGSVVIDLGEDDFLCFVDRASLYNLVNEMPSSFKQDQSCAYRQTKNKSLE
jgi:hypothetical protein